MEKMVLIILGMSFEAAVVTCAVLVLRFLFRRLPKSYSHVLWLLVLFRLLCPVAINSSLSLMPGGWQEETAYGYEEAGYKAAGTDAQSGFSEGALAVQPQENGVQTGGTAAAQPENEERTLWHAEAEALAGRTELWQKAAAGAFGSFWKQYGIWLSLIWLAGAVWLTAAYLVRYVNWRETVRGCSRRALSESTKLQQKRRSLWKTPLSSADLVESDRIQEPFVCGIVNPVIYLPAGMGEKERGYILRHERMHIQHGDPVVRLLWQIALVVHWFNPLVWLAVSLVQKDMEMFCDESVMKQGGKEARKEYAMTLLHFSVKKSGLPFPVAFGESNTESRIRHILTQKKPAVAAGALAVIAIALAAVFLLTDPKTAQGGSDAAAPLRQEDVEGLQDDGQKSGAEMEDPAKLTADSAQGNGVAEYGGEEAEQDRNEKILALAQRWAEASSDRDGNALAELLADPSKMDEYKLEDGGYFYGWSSPWPWNYNHRISYAYEKDEVIIHYYANTSDPRIWPWREVLTLAEEDGTWLVEDWTTDTEPVRSAVEFKERFHYEDPGEYGGDAGYGYRFLNTPMDMFERSGEDEPWVYGLLQNTETNAALRGQWETPEKAAETHLYLEGGRAVEVESPWEDKICLRWEFADGLTDVICLCHPYVSAEGGAIQTSELWAVENILEESVYREELERAKADGS